MQKEASGTHLPSASTPDLYPPAPNSHPHTTPTHPYPYSLPTSSLIPPPSPLPLPPSSSHPLEAALSCFVVRTMHQPLGKDLPVLEENGGGGWGAGGGGVFTLLSFCSKLHTLKPSPWAHVFTTSFRSLSRC